MTDTEFLDPTQANIEQLARRLHAKALKMEKPVSTMHDLGDDAAVDSFCAQLSNWTINYFVKRTHNLDAAKDLSQNVCAKFLEIETFIKYDPERDFTPYLATTCAHELSNNNTYMWRRRAESLNGEKNELPEILEDPDLSPPARIIIKEEHVLLEGLLHQLLDQGSEILSPNQKAVLRDWLDDVDPEVTEKRLQITHTNYGAIKSRALQVVKNMAQAFNRER